MAFRRLLLALALLAPLACSTTTQTRQTNPTTPTQKTSFNAADAVPVRTALDDEMFPLEWRSQAIQASADPVAPAEISRSEHVIRIALRKYPTGLLRANLETVYLVSELRYLGIAAGGTNSRERVYVADAGEKLGYSDAQLERTFHAELSSILLRNHPASIDERAWLAQNAPRFRYGGANAAIDAIKARRDSDAFSTRYLEDGQLTQYSRTDLENDFNAFAEHLWTGDRRLWDSAAKHSRIQRKLALVIAFYRALDPTLDEAYFKGLVRD